MVLSIIHTLYLEGHAVAGYKFIARYFSLFSFISLKYIYNCLSIIPALSLSPAFICRVGAGEQMDDAGT
jgi:hypothetical protein